MSKQDKLQSIHEEAMRLFTRAQDAVREERRQCLEDRRFCFIAGAQWEGSLARQFENKPKFEVNKVHLAVIRIINEYRNNRITVSFIAKDGKGSDDLADKCAGLYRSDEQDSCAEEAYDAAFEEAVSGGFGAWRLRAEYEDDEDEENDYQRICIEPIYDADSSVFFDPNSKRQDKSDAEYGFVMNSMTHDDFKAEFGVDPASVPKEITLSEYDWVGTDFVYVAEYYKKEKKKKLINVYYGLTGERETLDQEDIKENPDLELNLEARGFSLFSTKKIKCTKVRKYLISGSQVLEDCGLIAGKNIPIVPVYGKRRYIDGIERCMGHVRLCKDAQRLKNMQLSKLGELSARSSDEKPIVTPDQVIGHERMWAEDNIKNNPFLLINPLKDDNGNLISTAPTAYTKPPQVPPAMAALLQVTETDLGDILGNQDAGDEVQANLSGKAVELVQTRLDMQSFIYMSNFAKAMKRCGEIWLGMAQEIYVEEGRSLKTVGEKDEIGNTTLMSPTLSDDGSIEYESDLKNAKFDVAVDVGPTSSSKRSATLRALTGMMQLVSDPTDMAVLSGMAMMNMEGEGIGDVRDYYRKKMVGMGVIPPTQEERLQMQEEAANQQPDAQTLFLQAEAEKSQALAVKAQADTALIQAKTKDTIVQAAERLAGIDRDDQKQALDTAQALVKAASAQSQQMGE